MKFYGFKVNSLNDILVSLNGVTINSTLSDLVNSGYPYLLDNPSTDCTDYFCAALSATGSSVSAQVKDATTHITTTITVPGFVGGRPNQPR